MKAILVQIWRDSGGQLGVSVHTKQEAYARYLSRPGDPRARRSVGSPRLWDASDEHFDRLEAAGGSKMYWSQEEYPDALLYPLATPGSDARQPALVVTNAT